MTIEEWICTGSPHLLMTLAEIQFIGNLSGMDLLQLEKHAQEVSIKRLFNSSFLSSVHSDLMMIGLDLVEKEETVLKFIVSKEGLRGFWKSLLDLFLEFSFSVFWGKDLVSPSLGKSCWNWRVNFIVPRPGMDLAGLGFGKFSASSQVYSTSTFMSGMRKLPSVRWQRTLVGVWLKVRLKKKKKS